MKPFFDLYEIHLNALAASLLVFAAFLVPLQSCRRVPITVSPSRMDRINRLPSTSYDVTSGEFKKRRQLGEALFFDRILSMDCSISCGSCHLREFAFADTCRFSNGVFGQKTARNTPTLINDRYHHEFFWDGRATSIEQQVTMPITSPREMDMTVSDLVIRLNCETYYCEEFCKVFGHLPDSLSVVLALAAYVRGLVQFGNAADKWLAGDSNALSRSAARGAELFFGEKTECYHCHGNFDFRRDGFENIGLATLCNDSGRGSIDHNPSQVARFVVPSLRNVAISAPYMHDGRYSTMREVVEHYRRGGDGDTNSSVFIKKLALSEADVGDLIQFMYALTDSNLIENNAKN